MEGGREGGGRDIVVEWDRYEGGSGDASRHAGKRNRPQNNKTSGYNSSQMSLAQRKGDGCKVRWPLSTEGDEIEGGG